MRIHAITWTVALVLAACAYDDDVLWPMPPGGAAADASLPATVAPAADRIGTGTLNLPGVTPGRPTGTVAGLRIEELRRRLSGLQSSLEAHNHTLQEVRRKVVEDSRGYDATVTAISTRLQAGTAPGNPALVKQFNAASADLDRLSADVGALNNLAIGVTGDTALAADLAKSTRDTSFLSGAVDEDRRQLAVLQDEVDRTAVVADRLLSEISGDIERQSAYVSAARANLNTLATVIRYGDKPGGGRALNQGRETGPGATAGIGSSPNRGAVSSSTGVAATGSQVHGPVR